MTLAAALAALLALVLGYADLARGGTSTAAVLLVAGYCALVPWALWRLTARLARGAAVPNGKPAPAGYRPGYAAAALAAGLVLALYAATLAPTTAMWDASEYIAAARVLGLPHPPGSSLFVLLAHAFGLLPIPLSYAARINLFAALTSAVGAGGWFLVTERVLADWVPARWERLVGAAVATLVGATAFTVWNQSVVNEKVYTVSLLGLAVASWLALRWLDAPTAGHGDRLLVLVAYVLGLGYTNHPAGLLAAPAVALALVAYRPRTLTRPRVLAASLGALALGLSVFAFQPLRSAHSPPINEGEPTACAGRIGWECTLSLETARRLRANIQREQYGGHPVLDRQAPFGAQLGTWWLYFQWQWVRDPDGQHAAAQRGAAAAFFLLGLLGGVEHWRRGRRTFWYVGTLVATLTVPLVFYLNFKYGWSQAPALGDAVPREVRDRDYFFVWTYATWAVWVAVGLVAAWRALADRLAGSLGGGAPAARRALALSAPVLLVAVVPLVANRAAASRRGQTAAREWAVDLLNSVEPHGVIVTNGDNDSFPLWYAQQVEGVRLDVTVALTPYLGIGWYVRQLLRAPTHPYDSAAGPRVYAGRAWAPPTVPLLRLTAAQADSIPPYVELPTPQRFRHGAIDATVPAGYLTRDQLVVLQVIKDTFPARAVYFSPGGYAHALGLAPYLVREGLVDRLSPAPVRAGGDVVQTPGGFVNVARTRALWSGVYGGPRALVREGNWVDRASGSVPYNYALTGELLALGLLAEGDSAGAAGVRRTVADVARAGRLNVFLE